VRFALRRERRRPLRVVGWEQIATSLEPGLYEVVKLGKWAKSFATAAWSVEFEVRRDHERVTTGVLVVDARDGRRFFGDWKTEFVKRKALEHALDAWLCGLLRSGRVPEGELQVDPEVVRHGLQIIADADQLKRFETNPDWPLLSIAVVQANA
jgi:hypothetical protein